MPLIKSPETKSVIDIIHNNGLGYLCGDLLLKYITSGDTKFCNITIKCKAPIVHVVNTLKKNFRVICRCNSCEVRDKRTDRLITTLNFIDQDTEPALEERIYWNLRKKEIDHLDGPEALNQIKKYILAKNVLKKHNDWDYNLPEIHELLSTNKGLFSRHAHLDNKLLDEQTPWETNSKETTMTQQPTNSFFKECLHDGMWRSIGDNTVKHTKDIICATLKKKGADNTTLQFAGEFLDSKEGEAVVSLILAALLHYGPAHLPGLPDQIRTDPRVARLAKEYGTKASAEGMTIVYTELMQFAAPIFANLMQSMATLPPTNVRVENSTLDEADEEPDTEVVSDKQATA